MNILQVILAAVKLGTRYICHPVLNPISKLNSWHSTSFQKLYCPLFITQKKNQNASWTWNSIFGKVFWLQNL